MFTPHWAIPGCPDLCSQNRVPQHTTIQKHYREHTVFHIFKLI